MISRRFLFSTVAPAAVLVSLSGCATIGQALDSTLASVVADVQTAVSGAGAILPYLAGLNLPAAVTSTVQTVLADLQTVASSIAGVATQAAAQPLVQKLATYVGTLVATLLGAGVTGLPAIVTTILQALQVLIPAIAAAIGMVGVAAAAPTNMSVGSARAYLKLVAAH